MRPWLRVATLAYAGFLLILTLGFAFQMSWATRLWPWPDGRLSYIFVASICASVAALLVVLALIDEPAAAQAPAVDVLVVTVAGAIHFARLYGERDESGLLIGALSFAVGAVFAALAAIWAFRHDFRDRVRVPRLLFVSYAIFAGVLVLVGGALVLGRENIFPWPLRDDSATLYGWIFLGAATLFVWCLVRPYRSNAYAPLLAFLAYDAVLIVPFLRHFADVRSDLRDSLIIYTAVLVYSGAIAVYYLFIHPEMRVVTWPYLRERPAPTA